MTELEDFRLPAPGSPANSGDEEMQSYLAEMQSGRDADLFATEGDAPKAQQDWLQELYLYDDQASIVLRSILTDQDVQWREEGAWVELPVMGFPVQGADGMWSGHEQAVMGFPVQSADGMWTGPSPVRDFPPPPPMPEGDNVYKPHWVYGSCWPFNCAPTTLVLENLPMALTQGELIQVLDDEGFHGLYDFVFLPASLRTGKSSCHAVVNSVRHSHGLLLAAHFHGRTWGASTGGPHCKAKWSYPRQGLEELLSHYRNDLTMHQSVPAELRPALFNQGWRVPMPMPTKRIRAPDYQSSAKYGIECSAEVLSNGDQGEQCQSDKVDEDVLENFFGLPGKPNSEFPTLRARGKTTKA